MAAWSDYQEETARFFRDLGLDAETNVTLRGVRTEHDIDVVVRAKHVGFDILWLVECKLWQTPISKLHVLALREIVQDLGADRGILMAERGFQSGAFEAATLTNVQLATLDEVRISASDAFSISRLRSLEARVDACRERYWGLSKSVRMEHELRPDMNGHGYSATRVFKVVSACLNEAFRGRFPMREPDDPTAWVSFEEFGITGTESAADLVRLLEPVVVDLERRIERVHEALRISE